MIIYSLARNTTCQSVVLTVFSFQARTYITSGYTTRPVAIIIHSRLAQHPTSPTRLDLQTCDLGVYLKSDCVHASDNSDHDWVCRGSRMRRGL